MNESRILDSGKSRTRVTKALKILNLAWIRILSITGIFPVSVNFHSNHIKGARGFKMILFYFHLLSVQAQIVYYLQITIGKVKDDPNRAVTAFSFDYVLIVPSQVAILVATSYFLRSSRTTDSMFNDAMHYFQLQLSTRHTFPRGPSLLEIFTMFIPLSYVTSTIVIFAANVLLSCYGTSCGHDTLIFFWQGISITTWLAWCYFGTLFQLLVLERIDHTLVAERFKSR